MPYANCKFIKRVAEFQPLEESDHIPDNTRGIYILLNQVLSKDQFDVVYVGMSGATKAGIWSRLKRHRKSKSRHWTHFTLFEVHDNVTGGEIKELEGLIRHIYRKDSRTNRLNIQLCYKPFLKVRQNNIQEWNTKSFTASKIR